MKKKIFSLLVLLMTAVSGAWAADTYTVAGSNAAMFGSAWDADYTANDMTKNGDGTYSITYTNVYLDADVQYKVVKNHSWDEAYPALDRVINIAEAGTYTLTIHFNPTTHEVYETMPGAAPAYNLSVAPCDKGSGTVKFFVGEKEVKGANEGDKVNVTVTPDEGWVVGSVSANAYTTWAGARRKAPAAIPMLGNVTLTPVEGKANTWTFTMPAASVLVSAAYIPVAAFAPAEPSGTLAPTAAEGVIAGEDKAIIVAGTVANIPETTNPQGTVKYFVTDNKDMTAEQAAKANGWVEALPTAAGYTGSYADDFQVYVWYYIQAATGYADSEPQRIEVTVLSNLFDLTLKPAPVKNMTVTVAGQAKTPTDEGKVEAVKMGSEVKLKAADGYKFRKVEVKKKAAAPTTITVTWNGADITGTGGGKSFTKDGVTITAGDIEFMDKNFLNGGTFTTTLGNFTKIEVTTDGWYASGTGWSGSTWTGNASSVSFSGEIMGYGGDNLKFVFTIEPTN